MEKHYEMPKVQVVRYRKRVKTNTEFTDSSGVQHIGLRCPYCDKMVFAVRVDQITESTPIEEIDRLDAAFDAAVQAHVNECPNWPETSVY